MQIYHLTPFISLHISTVLLFLICLLTVAQLQQPNYYGKNTVFHRKRLLTLSSLAVKTGKSVKDKRAGKGMSVIPGNRPPPPPGANSVLLRLPGGVWLRV